MTVNAQTATRIDTRFHQSIAATAGRTYRKFTFADDWTGRRLARTGTDTNDTTLSATCWLKDREGVREISKSLLTPSVGLPPCGRIFPAASTEGPASGPELSGSDGHGPPPQGFSRPARGAGAGSCGRSPG
jgi:hypothetical protein